MLLVKFAQANMCQRKDFILDRPTGIGYYDLVFFKTATYIDIDGEITLINPNTMILYDKTCRQYYYTAEEHVISDFLHFEFEDEMRDNVLGNLIFNKPFSIEQTDVVERLMWLIAFEYHSNFPHRDNNSSHLLNVLLKKIEEEFSRSQIINDHGNFSEVISVKNRIMQNPQYNWSIRELAESCNMSESYFQIVYKKLFGTNCIADVISARLEMAKELILNSSSSIREISSCCGYNNIEHFSRQFKKVYGITPLKYRNIHRESKN